MSVLLRLATLAAAGLCAAMAQPAAHLIEWLSALQALGAQLDPRANRTWPLDEVAFQLAALYREIRAEGISIEEPPSPPQPEAMLAYIRRLRTVLEEIERRRPGGVFQLGRIEVNVTAEAPQVATAAVVDDSVYRARNAQALPDAIASLPGVSVERIGMRNERGVFVRGHDVRRVPVYVDGIPVYVPYDGYLDLDRFLTSQVSEVQVAKGFTSPLYGPNAIGGAISLISKGPAEPLDFDLGTGYASGRQIHGFANVGTRRRLFSLLGSYSWLSSDSFPLSSRFRPVPSQPPGLRLNAYRADQILRLRLGWTPNSRDQYTFTCVNQQAEKGQPPYAGLDPTVRLRFWQWPQWDKQDYYFVGNKALGAGSYLRARLYVDKFRNLVKAFDDARYATQTSRSSFTSRYDDGTYGAILEFGIRGGQRHGIKSSVFFKDDIHREGNLGEPVRSFRDHTFSLGLEDTVRLTGRTSVALGASGDYLAARRAQDFQQGRLLPFPLESLLAWNAQAGAFHALSETSRLRFTFARKTRLPTMKDRFSYRLGTSLPNPYLRAESSSNWEVGYWKLLPHSTLLEGACFGYWIGNTMERFFVAPNVYQLRNLGRARYLGAEIALRSSAVARVTWQASYTYLSRKNLWDPGTPATGAPRHRLYAALVLQPLSRLTLLADTQVEAARFEFNDAGRLLRSEPFAIVGLAATVRLTRLLELQSGLSNLFDRNYFFVDGYPEPGRNAYLNLRWRF